MTYTNEEKEKAFWAFLRKNKATTGFKRGMAKKHRGVEKCDIAIKNDPRNIIMDSIIWNDTKEMGNYWADLHRKWGNHCEEINITIMIAGYSVSMDKEEEMVHIGCYSIPFKKIKQVYELITS